MDQAEAQALGLDFKDITTLQQGGLDVSALRRVMQSLIVAESLQTEKLIRDDYDRRLRDINSSIQKLLSVTKPVEDLTNTGKTLE